MKEAQAIIINVSSVVRDGNEIHIFNNDGSKQVIGFDTARGSTRALARIVRAISTPVQGQVIRAKPREYRLETVHAR